MNETEKLPGPLEALEFRRDQYGWSQAEMAGHLGMSAGKYSEVVNGKRRLSLEQIRRAVAIGVPADVIIQPFACEKKQRQLKLERRIKDLQEQLKEVEGHLEQNNSL